MPKRKYPVEAVDEGNKRDNRAIDMAGSKLEVQEVPSMAGDIITNFSKECSYSESNDEDNTMSKLHTEKSESSNPIHVCDVDALPPIDSNQQQLFTKLASISKGKCYYDSFFEDKDLIAIKLTIRESILSVVRTRGPLKSC